MAYEIGFAKYENGEEVAIQSDSARKVFERFGIRDFGTPAYVQLPDGLSIDCQTNSLNSESTCGFAIEFRNVSGSLFELIYALCSQCKLVAIIVDDPYVPIVCDRSLVAGIPTALTSEHDPVFCGSKEEVAQQVCPGFDRWADWVSRRPSHLNINDQPQ